MMVSTGMPCRFAVEAAADLVLCGLNAISIPGLVRICVTHLKIVLLDTGPNSFIVLISSFSVILMLGSAVAQW